MRETITFSFTFGTIIYLLYPECFLKVRPDDIKVFKWGGEVSQSGNQSAGVAMVSEKINIRQKRDKQ